MVLRPASPGITGLIRDDHAELLATFHAYRPTESKSRKQAIVELACVSLEVHAQLEEEIFYPALRAVTSGSQVLDNAGPEHDELRHLIARLRRLAVGDTVYDVTFMSLLRKTLHHVADEESILLPEAERLLADRLPELGARMRKRRLELLGRRGVRLLAAGGRAPSRIARVASVAAAVVAAGALGYGAAKMLEKRYF